MMEKIAAFFKQHWPGAAKITFLLMPLLPRRQSRKFQGSMIMSISPGFSRKEVLANKRVWVFLMST